MLPNDVQDRIKSFVESEVCKKIERGGHQLDTLGAFEVAFVPSNQEQVDCRLLWLTERGEPQCSLQITAFGGGERRFVRAIAL